MTANTVPYEELKRQSLQDPEIRAAYEALEPAYQLACLRIERGLTQVELAERAGTTQSSIARLESGKCEPRLSTLHRVAAALGARVELRLVPQNESAPGTMLEESVHSSQA